MLEVAVSTLYYSNAKDHLHVLGWRLAKSFRGRSLGFQDISESRCCAFGRDLENSLGLISAMYSGLSLCDIINKSSVFIDAWH